MVLLVAVALGWWVIEAGTETYATFERPDGHYRVVVLRHKSWFGVMPGQAGDASGVVQLRDQNGKLLQQTTVPMVQLVEQVRWEEKHLSIKLVAEWPLPD